MHSQKSGGGGGHGEETQQGPESDAEPERLWEGPWVWLNLMSLLATPGVCTRGSSRGGEGSAPLTAEISSAPSGRKRSFRPSKLHPHGEGSGRGGGCQGGLTTPSLWSPALATYPLEDEDSEALLPKFSFFLTLRASQPPWFSTWPNSLSSGGKGCRNTFGTLSPLAFIFKGVRGHPPLRRVGKRMKTQWGR